MVGVRSFFVGIVGVLLMPFNIIDQVNEENDDCLRMRLAKRCMYSRAVSLSLSLCSARYT